MIVDLGPGARVGVSASDEIVNREGVLPVKAKLQQGVPLLGEDLVGEIIRPYALEFHLTEDDLLKLSPIDVFEVYGNIGSAREGCKPHGIVQERLGGADLDQHRRKPREIGVDR